VKEQRAGVGTEIVRPQAHRALRRGAADRTRRAGRARRRPRQQFQHARQPGHGAAPLAQPGLLQILGLRQLGAQPREESIEGGEPALVEAEHQRIVGRARCGRDAPQRGQRFIVARRLAEAERTMAWRVGPGEQQA
jgi:hypothetical protein